MFFFIFIRVAYLHVIHFEHLVCHDFPVYWQWSQTSLYYMLAFVFSELYKWLIKLSAGHIYCELPDVHCI